MLYKKIIDDMVEAFLECNNERERKRFYKHLMDEAIFECGGEDYVINIMSIDTIEGFHNLDEDAQMFFINAFLKSNILKEVRRHGEFTVYIPYDYEE